MKKLRILQHQALIVSIGLFITIIAACNTGRQNSNETQNQNVQNVVCSKGLSYSKCSNPPAMHGQIMIHNMTEKSFEVKVEHHPNEYETKQIAPNDGWTFVGVIQGKTLITAKPYTGGKTFESTCTVIGNTQHMMNVTSDGIVMKHRLMEHYGN